MNVTLSDKNILSEKKEFTGVHPQKFALWLAMASMTMFFASLTSALLVKKGDFTVWENFRLPSVFLYSTITVISMSIVLQYALYCYRHAKFSMFRPSMLVAFLLGCSFLALQFTGWQQLKAMGMTLTGNLSASFVYLITAMHGVHIIAGLILTLLFIFFAIRSRKDPIYELRDIINPKRQLNLEMLVSYWHFVDIVWVYLYIFFRLNYQ